MNEIAVPSLEQIVAAQERIRPHAVRTPLLESAAINELTGGRILFKPEVLQTTGSFKFRGACNRMLQLSAVERRAGVVAFSSGNHALAVSAVAQMMGVTATILMPADAPRIKIEGARKYGAVVQLYDRRKEDREAIAANLVAITGALTVPPFDDPHVITGQGTVGLEIAQDLLHLRLVPDAVVAPCSGGGLIAGLASAIRNFFPETLTYAVEPADFDDLARSLATGKRERNALTAESICDALQVATPGILTFPLNRNLLAGGLTVTDDEVKHAMQVVFSHLKLVVEPGGAAACAALLAGKLDVRGKTVVAVLSGGNVDPATFSDIVGSTAS